MKMFRKLIIVEKLGEQEDEMSAVKIDLNHNNTLLKEENDRLAPLRDKKMESLAKLQKLNLDMASLSEEENRIKNLQIKSAPKNGATKILDKINININRGEILGLIGESGSGKSMLGCALLEMVPMGCLITKGSIIHHFNSNKRISKIRGVHIAMISQDPMQALNPLQKIKTQFAIILRRRFARNKKSTKEQLLRWMKKVNLHTIPNILDREKNNPLFETKLFNKKLENPIGMAAGFDKNAEVYNSLFKLGFGFVEVGTITPLRQYGNPKPRVFRLVEDEALINRLGFNNKGVDYLVSKIKNKKFNAIIGVNIGANKASKGSERVNDYLICLEKVHKYADYITINISSPNTPNLRDLHNKDHLNDLIVSIDNIVN